METVKYDIIGLAEVRRQGEAIDEYKDYILCYKGETPGRFGVGFLLKKHMKKYLENFEGISERLAVLNLSFEDYQLSIIQVYAPTEAASDDQIHQFYETLNSVVAKAHKNIIIMGDFNAKIGKGQPEEKLLIKNHGYGTRNERGETLVKFAFENKLSVLNTYYKKRPSCKWTWRSPNGKIKNEIDYILSNQPTMFLNVEVLNINYPQTTGWSGQQSEYKEPKRAEAISTT
ncbi:craniofacial development protein 2-like [Leguminivora glycinivorella]|uniref:craniofacial development protein 2-like n=1 Tax=Leguminivora glycinivorella TaxID=1035111 RepID=UPI00200ECAE4|nr:craniofacial development protein 2-like [Leguminivora glycinivorella]